MIHFLLLHKSMLGYLDGAFVVMCDVQEHGVGDAGHQRTEARLQEGSYRLSAITVHQSTLLVTVSGTHCLCHIRTSRVVTLQRSDIQVTIKASMKSFIRLLKFKLNLTYNLKKIISVFLDHVYSRSAIAKNKNAMAHFEI